MRHIPLKMALTTGCALLALLAAERAAAQETALPEVVVQNDEAGTAENKPGENQTNEVEDQTGIGAVNGVVAKRTLVGTKTPTSITEIPQSISVVGREEIDDHGAQKADEALRYTAGVFAQPFGPDSDTNWIFIRGFQASQTGVFQDGLSLFGYAFGGLYVDPFGLERIEVLKGPASVLYGGSNPGGLVNYVSKRPEFERLRYAEAGINDAGTAYFGFDVGDSVDDMLAYRVVGKIQGGDGYSEYQDGWRGIISPSITWNPNDKTSLTVLANYTNIDETHGGGSFLPYDGTVTDRVVDGKNYGRIDPHANFTEPGDDTYNRQQGSIGYEFAHEFAPDWTFRSNARFTAAAIDEVNIYTYGWDGPTTLSRINFGHDTNVSAFVADNSVTGVFETMAIEHTLLMGVDYKYYLIDQVQSSGLFGTTPSIDAFHPHPTGNLGKRVSYLNQDLTQQQLGAYVQDQLRFGGGFILTLGGRYDWNWLEQKNGPTYWAPDDHSKSNSENGAWSGRAGLGYEFKNGMTPYMSVSSIYDPLIGVDVNGDLFEPETGTQYEAGIKYAPTWLDGLFTLAIFDLTRQNVPSNVTPFTQIQTGEINSRGVEFEAKINVTDNFQVTSAVTAYDVRITEDENEKIEGNTPFLVPEFMASAWFAYTVPNGWAEGVTIAPGIRYVGSSYADNENTLVVPAATLVDGMIGYEWGNWGADLNVSNIFDLEYVASCQTALTCSYGEGRSVKLRLYANF